MITDLSSEYTYYVVGGSVCLRTILFITSSTCTATGLALQAFGYALHVTSPYRPGVSKVGDSPEIPTVPDNRCILGQRTWGISFAMIGLLLNASGAALKYIVPNLSECN